MKNLRYFFVAGQNDAGPRRVPGVSCLPRIADYTLNKVPAPLRQPVGDRGAYREVGEAAGSRYLPACASLLTSARNLIAPSFVRSGYIFTPQRKALQLTIFHVDKSISDAAPPLSSGRHGA